VQPRGSCLAPSPFEFRTNTMVPNWWSSCASPTSLSKRKGVQNIYFTFAFVFRSEAWSGLRKVHMRGREGRREGRREGDNIGGSAVFVKLKNTAPVRTEAVSRRLWFYLFGSFLLRRSRTKTKNDQDDFSIARRERFISGQGFSIV